LRFELRVRNDWVGRDREVAKWSNHLWENTRREPSQGRMISIIAIFASFLQSVEHHLVPSKAKTKLLLSDDEQIFMLFFQLLFNAWLAAEQEEKKLWTTKLFHFDLHFRFFFLYLLLFFRRNLFRQLYIKFASQQLFCHTNEFSSFTIHTENWHAKIDSKTARRRKKRENFYHIYRFFLSKLISITQVSSVVIDFDVSKS
jgi:hypothetical protein